MNSDTLFRKLDCERCKLRTEHARVRKSVMTVVWPYTVYRLDYPTSKYRCLKCGQVREYVQGQEIEEAEKGKYPVDEAKTQGVW